MTSPSTVPNRRSIAGVVGGAAFGAVFLAWIAGARILDPTEIDWVMKGDWVPHHFGWHFFRIEPWHWPPGSIHSYYAPLGTSIGLTDSIPLAAYILKPFGRWLPAEFQYLGPWLLLSFTLQGALGARLVGRWIDSAWVQAAGGAFCVLLPMLLARVGHTALCSQWLVLWALLLATRTPPAGMRHWTVLALVAGLVQPYLAAMVLGIAAAALLGSSQWPLARRVRILAATIAAMAVGWWLAGLFILGGGDTFTEGGLGYFSMNLLAFVTPLSWSRFLPAVPVAGPGQQGEGFLYLGAGVLALVVLAVSLAVAARRSHRAIAARIWPPLVVAAAVVMAIFALSPVVTFGSRVILDLNGPWAAPLATFRSSGRFAWPLAYVLVIWTVVTVARRLPDRAALAALGLALVVQFVDLHDAHQFRRRAARDPEFHAWPQLFAPPRWETIAAHYRHFELVPAPQCGVSPIPYEPAVRVAAVHALTVNAGVIARRDLRALRQYCLDADAVIDAVRLRDDTIYVVTEPAAGVITRMGGRSVACGRIATVWMCTTAAAHSAWADAAPFD